MQFHSTIFTNIIAKKNIKIQIKFANFDSPKNAVIFFFKIVIKVQDSRNLSLFTCLEKMKCIYTVLCILLILIIYKIHTFTTCMYNDYTKL